MQVQVRRLLEGCVLETEVRQGEEKSSSSLNKEMLNLHIASGKEMGKTWSLTLFWNSWTLGRMFSE